jgi:hypothetical protein
MALAVHSTTDGNYWSTVEQVTSVERGVRRVWHAVALDEGAPATTTLCRWQYRADALNTSRPWHTTVWAYRCPTCERLVGERGGSDPVADGQWPIGGDAIWD